MKGVIIYLYNTTLVKKRINYYIYKARDYTNKKQKAQNLFIFHEEILFKYFCNTDPVTTTKIQLNKVKVRCVFFQIL